MTPMMESAWAALRSLAYPRENEIPPSSPPVVSKLTMEVEEPGPLHRDKFEFRIEFTNGTVLWGDLRNISGTVRG